MIQVRILHERIGYAREVLHAFLYLSLLVSPQTEQAKPVELPFESDIVKFEEQDRLNPPAKGGIVFVGSSSIRGWTTLAQDFPGKNVINRGFGGSQISDSVRYAQRIVTPYQPKMVVFFAGTNDIAGGKSAETVANDFKEFVSKVHEKLPRTKIAFISISPAPSRWSKIDEIKRANRLIQGYIRLDRRLRFVDVFSQMLAPDGGPRPELFVSDMLHLNADGYALWTKAVAPYLPD